MLERHSATSTLGGFLTNTIRDMEELPIQRFSLSQRDYIPNSKLASLGPWLERRVTKSRGNNPSLIKSFYGISRNSFLVFNDTLTADYIVHGERVVPVIRTIIALALFYPGAERGTRCQGSIGLVWLI